MRGRLLAVLVALQLPTMQQGWAADDPHPSARFPLRVEAGGAHLLDRQGRPFLVHGDTAWSMIAQLRREDVDLYLADRKARGFNALLVNLIEHQFAAKAPSNAYGEPPFPNGKPFLRPNAAYFNHAAWVLRRAEEMGFAVFLTPAYLGANGGGQGWHVEAAEAGASALRDYAKFVARRFADRKNIIWVQGGDYDPPDKAIIGAVASGIAEVSHGALQTVHLSRDMSIADRWGEERWLTLDTVYTYQDVHAAVLAHSSRRSGRPAVMIEGLYEGEHGTDAEMIRRQAYGALLAGASGQFFGNNPIWHFGGPGLYAAEHGWREALDSPGARSITHLRDLFDGVEWWLLKPGTRLARLDVKGDAYIASSPDGSFGIGYLTGQSDPQANVRAGDRTVEIQWFDPSSGERHPPQRLAPETSTGLQPPAARNAGGGRDWVFVLRSKE